MNNIEKQIREYKPFDEAEARDQKYILDLMARYDNIFSRENDFVHFSASGLALNEDFTKMICVYHNIFGGWVYPGGHADGNENLLDVALGETEEECFDVKDLNTGLYFKTRPVFENIFSLQSFAIKGHYKKGVYIPAHIHLDILYLLMIDERRRLKVKPDENAGVALFDLNELSGNSIVQMVDFVEPVIQKNIKKLKQMISKI